MIRFSIFLLCVGTSALAQSGFLLPGNATVTSESFDQPGTFHMPVRPIDADGDMNQSIDGIVSTRTFRIDGLQHNTLAITQSFRLQLADDGYDLLLDCDQITCGGFDFRFGFEVAPTPKMEVDLTDYRYIAATKLVGAGPVYASFLVSRTSAALYVQIVEISSARPEILLESGAENSPLPEPVQQSLDVATELARVGRMRLNGLEFASGKGDLAADPNEVLPKVAKWLVDNPQSGLILVGHSDNEGSFQSNQLISRQRAESVRQALITVHGANPEQIVAEGVGYLAPEASNSTPDGRAFNRRVEIVLR